MIGRLITEFIDKRGSDLECENSHAMKLWKTFMPFRSYPYTQTDEEKEKDPVSERIYRHSWWKNEVVKIVNRVKLDTLWKAFKQAERQHGDDPCVRFRPIYDVDHANGTLVYDYSQCYSIVSSITQGFHQLGIKQGEIVSVVSEASLFDVFIMLSCSYAGYTLSMYDEGCTDHESRLKLFQKIDSRIILTGIAHLNEILCGIENGDIKFEKIIIFPSNAMLISNSEVEDQPSEVDLLRASKLNVQIMYLTQLMTLGETCTSYRPESYDTDSLGFLFWNDDSGEFKAVKHTHKSMAIVAHMLSIESSLTNKDIYFSCTSIGNIYEMNLVSAALFSGASIAFATFRQKDLLNDIMFSCPTILLLPEDGLNMLFNQIKNIRFSLSSILGKAFDMALARCESAILHDQSFGIIETSCLNTLRWYTGMSNVRIAGSPVNLLSPTLAVFVKTFISQNLVQGFGCPEVGGITLYCPGSDGNRNLLQCGQPLRHIMIKLDGETHSSEKAWAPLRNMGCLQVQGRGTMSLGYLSDEDAEPAKWFPTNQVTRINHDGSFTTIGNTTNAFRGQFGFSLKSSRIFEFFYLQLWEISQICILTLSKRTHVAIVVPHAYWVRQVCQNLDPGILDSSKWGKMLSKVALKYRKELKQEMTEKMNALYLGKKKYEDACSIKDIILETNIDDCSSAFSRREGSVSSNGEVRKFEIRKR